MKTWCFRIFLFHPILFLLICFFAANTLAAEYVNTGNKVLNHAQKIGQQIAGERPSPKVPKDEGIILIQGHDPEVDTSRNPFQRIKPKKEAAWNYGKIVEGFFLRGIINVRGRRVALFEINQMEGSILRRVRQGEKIRVPLDSGEAVFTITRLGERSAVVTGENGTEYKVWL